MSKNPAHRARRLHGKAHALVVEAARLQVPSDHFFQVLINHLAVRDPDYAQHLLTLAEIMLQDRADFVDQLSQRGLIRGLLAPELSKQLPPEDLLGDMDGEDA